MKKDLIVEYMQSKKYFIKSKRIWLNDCEYTTILLKTNFPDNPNFFKKGLKQTIKIIGKEDNIYTLETTSSDGIVMKFKIIKTK